MTGISSQICREAKKKEKEAEKAQKQAQRAQDKLNKKRESGASTAYLLFLTVPPYQLFKHTCQQTEGDQKTEGKL